MKKALIAISIVTAVFLGSYSTASAAGLIWTGCGITKKAFMKELATAFKAKTGVSITLKGGGATRGIQATVAGRSDMGGSCRNKINVPEEAGANLTLVAWDALVIIVKQDNPISAITKAKVKDVFLGKITNWSQLGGDDKPINLYVRKGKTSGVGLTFRNMVFKDPNVDFSGAAFLKRSSGNVEIAVGGDIYAIGVSGVSSARKRKNLKFLSVDKVKPSKENLMNGKYPYFRPLYIVSKGAPKGDVKAFIDFALSAEGQAIISGQGTVNIKEGAKLQALYKQK